MKDPRFIARHNLRVNVPVGEYTAIRSGGNADFFTEVGDRQALLDLLQASRKNALQVSLIGSGSRTVFSDHGVRGLVVRNLSRGVEITGQRAYAESGVMLGEFIQQLAREECGGFEELVGHPGTVGGCLMDASAVLMPLRQAVEAVEIWCDGEVQELPWGEVAALSNPVILSARFRLESRSAADLQRSMLTATQQRLRHEPGALPHVRVFGNSNASELLRQLDVAGERVGGAVVSTKDPNYVINDRKAASHDVYELAQRMRHRVTVRLQHKLTESVVWQGSWAAS